jgi:membrane protease YdiL (CAAX protease family)
MFNNTSVKTREVLLFAFLIEGFLALCFIYWRSWNNINLPLSISLKEFLEGLFFALPLLLANLLVLYFSFKIQFLGEIKTFYLSALKPLADALSPSAAVCAAVCAGVGEELFFRGLLQTSVGLLPSSLVFAVAHFGFEIVRFPLTVLLYVMMSLYIGEIYNHYSLGTVVVLHATYDFMAIMALRNLAFPSSTSTHTR